MLYLPICSLKEENKHRFSKIESMCLETMLRVLLNPSLTQFEGSLS